MSENLDLVCSIVAAWERGDFSSAEWADLRSSSTLDGRGDRKRQGVEQMSKAWRTTMSGFRAEAYRELDDASGCSCCIAARQAEGGGFEPPRRG